MLKKLIVFAILVLFVQPAHANRRDQDEEKEYEAHQKKAIYAAQAARPENTECMRDTALNQKRATEYIVGLMQNSKSGSRPALIQNQTCASDIAYNEVIVIMERAERMVQSGSANLITEPDFRFNGNE